MIGVLNKFFIEKLRFCGALLSLASRKIPYYMFSDLHSNPLQKFFYSLS
jgi:hypothetical protein